MLAPALRAQYLPQRVRVGVADEHLGGVEELRRGEAVDDVHRAGRMLP